MPAASDFDHNKLIAAAAKEALKPLGLRREGKSRLWYDDHGWWCIVVEFQPSSWSRGTYLNVGVSWLLYEHAYWTFDVGYREQGFEPAKTVTKFADALTSVVDHARRSIQFYRDRFATIAQAHEHYRSHESQGHYPVMVDGHWYAYHAAVIAALAGDIDAARRSFTDLLALERRWNWQQGLYYRALDLYDLLDDRHRFIRSVAGIVQRTRAQRNLEEYMNPDLGLPEFDGK